MKFTILRRALTDAYEEHRDPVLFFHNILELPELVIVDTLLSSHISHVHIPYMWSW
jgi:uncharacterized protein YwlG (UPF0340 family)